MNLIGGTDSFRHFKIISVNNKKVKDEGRYKTKASPGDAAKKAFTQLSKKYKTNKLTFSIKETTQDSNKKIYGPYLGKKTKLKKPLTVKYKGKNGKNKLVMIKYETTIHLLKDHKQKGGKVSNEELKKFNDELKKIHNSIKDESGFRLGKKNEGYLGNSGILSKYNFISKKFQNIGPNQTKRSIVAEHVTEEELKEILNAERKTAAKILGSPGAPPGGGPSPGGSPPGGKNSNNNNNYGNALRNMFGNNNNNNSSNLSNNKFTNDGNDLRKMFGNNNNNPSPPGAPSPGAPSPGAPSPGSKGKGPPPAPPPPQSSSYSNQKPINKKTAKDKKLGSPGSKGKGPPPPPPQSSSSSNQKTMNKKPSLPLENIESFNRTQLKNTAKDKKLGSPGSKGKGPPQSSSDVQGALKQALNARRAVISNSNSNSNSDDWSDSSDEDE